jgi:hypothetical protein
MTGPNYHHYLLPNDLRTPEDVANWLRTVDEARHVHEPSERGDDVPILDWLNRLPAHMEARHASAILDGRLDRERRQACRRGARIRFGYFAWYARLVRAGKDWELDSPELASESAWDDVEAVLAFRAAARAK